MKTPIVFIIFRRPDETSSVFSEIRKAKPEKLFIIADGPRNTEEKELTDRTREIVSNINWKCEIYKDFSEKNMGCRERVVSGLNWVFDNTDKAIILEDDCLPNQDFFRFSEEMLIRYEDNENIMHIGGSNFQQENNEFKKSLNNSDYYFSKISQIWGWATWKRAWNKYDERMDTWSSKRSNKNFRKVFPNLFIYQYWKYIFDKMYKDEFDTWDIAWTYTCFKENGLCIMPIENLVENIGKGPDATHKTNNLTNIKAIGINFPLKHPSEIKVNQIADKFTYEKVYGVKSSLIKIIKSYIKEYLPFLFKHIKLFLK